MNDLPTPPGRRTGRPSLNLFWALSRTPHALIDMAAPALAALLCLGAFPPLQVTLLGLVTVFAGYTAVYALNDVVDYRSDREKVRIGGYRDGDPYLDGVLVRHPMAKGVLRFSAGLAWTAGWGALALAGAWLLNPVCALIFLFGCLLEGIYCLLWRVSPLRTLVNGVVKAAGSVAAVFAVDPSPDPLFLGVLTLWICCWEIGGQNIPNDWTDIQEDRHFGARTIPVVLGPTRSRILLAAALTAAFLLNHLLLLVSGAAFRPVLHLAAVGINLWLLLLPARRLYDLPDRNNAMALFNRASHYPLAMLLLVLASLAG